MSTGKSSKHSKHDWERFTSFKQRGEWVELQVMAQAAKHCLAVSKPWGETQAYDVGIEDGSNFLRVQVKSASRRIGGGYICRFEPHYHKKRDYTLEQIDLFAAYVIPVDAWYLIPASILLGVQRIGSAMLSPVLPPVKRASYRYECYREAWGLLTRSRSELAACSVTMATQDAARSCRAV